MTAEMNRHWRPVGATDPYRSTAGQIPEVGQIIGWRPSRKAWRVLQVAERHQANWDPVTLQVWERAGRPHPKTWRLRERSLIVEPARNPSPSGKDRRGLRLYVWWSEQQWFALTDPYPACVDCGLLWPCPCDDRNHKAAAAMAELDRLGAVLPGCCWACGDPITSRQHSIEFPGENLLLPGADRVLFHTSHSRKAARGPSGNQTCRGEANAYEARWLAAASGRKARLTCPGMMFRHFDYSECTTGDACPGEGASHADFAHCTTGRGDEQALPVTLCGGRGCRGPEGISRRVGGGPAVKRPLGVAELHGADIVRRYQAGESLRAIGEPLGLSHVVVRQVLADAGVDARRVGPPRAAERHRAEIVRRYVDDQQSIRHIAGALGLSYTGVRTVLTRARVDLRPAGQRPGQTNQRA